MVSRAPDRPNIVFVLTDDQGPWALGSAGNSEIKTPVLDGLAAAGVRLESFFCASPVCSPARASLLTGQVPSRHGVHDYLFGREVGPSATDYLVDQLTFTDLLADAGYRLGLSGKWHLGANEQPRRGFVHWFAHESGSSPYYDAPMYRHGERESAPGYLTDLLADDAQDFIAAESDRTEPFYLSLHFTAPHSPWKGQHPDEIAALYADCAFESCPQGPLHPWTPLSHQRPLGGESDTRAALIGYFAAVTAMDQALGRVLSTLDEYGLTEATLVVFSSDNGFNAGHHGVWGKGNGTFPQNMYDSSVKVPAILAQPGRLAEGEVRSELLSAYDLGATILELAGVPHLALEQGPGRSFAQLLTPAAPADHQRSRVVVFDEYGPVRMIRTRQWKYVHRFPDGPHELYDLAADSGEVDNLAAAPDLEAVRAELRAELTGWFSQHADPARDGLRLPVIGTGQRARVGQPEAFQGPLWDSLAGESGEVRAAVPDEGNTPSPGSQQ